MYLFDVESVDEGMTAAIGSISVEKDGDDSILILGWVQINYLMDEMQLKVIVLTVEGVL